VNRPIGVEKRGGGTESTPQATVSRADTKRRIGKDGGFGEEGRRRL